MAYGTYLQDQTLLGSYPFLIVSIFTNRDGDGRVSCQSLSSLFVFCVSNARGEVPTFKAVLLAAVPATC